MKRIIRCLCIVGLMVSCSKEPGPSASVEVVDGIEYVHNSAEPLHPEKTLTFEEELSLGGEDANGSILIYEPRSFLVDRNENIYIVDGRDVVLRVFDADGNYLRSIGKKGEGPGEFKSFGYLAFLPDGRLLIMDNQARRTSLFDHQGRFMSSHPWTKTLGRLQFVTDSFYVCSEYAYKEGDDPIPERELFINVYDLEGNEVRSFGKFTLPKMKVRTDGGNITAAILPPHTPQSVFAGDSTRQRLYHCLSSAYLIEVFDKTGKIVRKIDRPYDPLPFTSEDRRKFLARYDKSRNPVMKEMAQSLDFPIIKAIVSRMVADDEGRLWVATWEQKTEGGVTYTAYDIFDSSGRYDAKVWIDKPPLSFFKGKMYRMHTDEETGYRFLKRYRAIWSE